MWLKPWASGCIGCADCADAVELLGREQLLFFFFTLVTGPKRSLSLKLSDTRVCGPQIRARLGTTAHFGRPPRP